MKTRVDRMGGRSMPDVCYGGPALCEDRGWSKLGCTVG